MSVMIRKAFSKCGTLKGQRVRDTRTYVEYSGKSEKVRLGQ